MQKSKIEWTDSTYNPIRVKGGGFYCFKVSPACTHCYAETMARRIAAMQHTTEQPYTNRLIFPEVELNTEMLESWAKKTRAKKNFVSSMTDVFGEFVPDYMVFEILDAMLAAPKQIFQVLSKRAERAYKLITDWLMLRGLKKLPKNIWIGFSVEDQIRAEERIAWLLKIPAFIKFLSCEPLLGLLNLKQAFNKKNGVKWVIVGGESGNKRTIRPMLTVWARFVRDQCEKARVPFFFKQFGEYIDFEQMPEQYQLQLKQGTSRWKVRDVKFRGNIYTLHRVGKHNTGAVLDGKEHKNFPQY